MSRQSRVHSPGGSSIIRHAAVCLSLAGSALAFVACSGPRNQVPASDAGPQAMPAVMMQPRNGQVARPGAPRDPRAVTDLTQPGAVVWGTAKAIAEDMSTIPLQRQVTQPWKGPVTDIEQVLGEQDELIPNVPAGGPPNSLPLGGINMGGIRPDIKPMFPGIGQTPWTPPDCTLGVGPSHVLSTVNMVVAWWNKTGTLQFSSNLDNSGSPGFFESVGCGNFTFDPKCFFDQYAQRWVVIAPEVYGSTEAWICIAVSDDSNPNGTWYKYRTDAVINVSGNTFWWDYPGFGYDQNAYYVTGNLFGLNNGGWGGVGYRIFTKAPLLTGQPAVYSTLRDGGAGSVQIAHTYGGPATPFFVSVNSGNSMKVQAITNPITSPAIATTTVTVPTWSGETSSPSANGNSVGGIDSRIFNVAWRNGNLYATHTVNAAGTNVSRWYHFNTGNWPTSGGVSLVESGNINPGGGKHTYFGAIGTNAFNDVALVVGSSTSADRISVNAVGRRATDAPGTMGPLTQLRLSGADGGGRWGDYYGIVVDPSDDATFWVIGETAESSGWGTWIDKFTITTAVGPYATDDEAGTVIEGVSKTVDVLANDGDTGGLTFILDTFQPATAHGGTVTRSVGTGPGGRDQLIIQSAPGYSGADSFTYTIKNTSNVSDGATVTLTSAAASQFRNPENPASTEPGLDVSWYAFGSTQTSMPNFSSLTPYLKTSVAQLDFTTLLGQFMNSTRVDRVGGVFTGYIEVPAIDYYTFYVNSNDGSKMYVGNTLVVNNDHINSTAEQSGVIGLKPGKHLVRFEFYENSGEATLQASYSSSTLARTIVPTTAFFNDAPCPADFDHSGFVDIEDYTAFVQAFEAGDDSADFDGSGFVDIEDFTSFVVAFEAGC